MSNLQTIGISEYKIAMAPAVLVSYGLGSCVGIALYDSVLKCGALAHTLLPTRPSVISHGSNSAKYTDEAIEIMVSALLENGCAVERLVAKLAGGASMFEPVYKSFRGEIGERNVATAKSCLAKHGIPLIGEDTGQDYGRTIEFHTTTGALLIKSLQRPGRTL
jgi:chemotaxis protein CheD